ncbi:MAG: FkbM family methyltransferase [Patescibacteria group bacterium]
MTISEFIYTVILRPQPLRNLTNRILRAIIPQSVNRHGAKIFLDPDDPVLSGAFVLRVFERPETDFFIKTIRPGMTFLDVGANVGYYTALALSVMGKNARIVSIEPNPQSFKYLLKTVAANDGKNVSCIQKAASNQAGSMPIFLNLDNHADNRLYANNMASSSCEVSVETIDKMLEGVGVSKVDFIKIDVQGYEGHALSGMKETIRRSPKLQILSEFWPAGLLAGGTDPKTYLSELHDLGLELFELTKNRRLQKIMDFDELIKSHTGRLYTNIIGIKS